MEESYPITLPDMIETDRLILRRWKESDLPAFAAMNADPKVMEYFPKVLSREESDASAESVKKHFDEHQFGLWAVEVKDEVEFAGFIGLKIPQFEAEFTPCVEIGWRLAATFWGRGFAPEGAHGSLDFAFDCAGLEEVVSMTAVSNHRSRRVMEKLGMARNASEDFDHPMLPKDHPLCRHVLYRLNRNDWSASK